MPDINKTAYCHRSRFTYKRIMGLKHCARAEVSSQDCEMVFKQSVVNKKANESCSEEKQTV